MPFGLVMESDFVVPSGLSPRQTNRSAALFTPFTDNVRTLGRVVRETKVPVFFWNGAASNISLTDVLESGDYEGISYDATPPQSVIALTSEYIVFLVDPEGPLVFTAEFDFITAETPDPVLTLTGTRAPQLSGDVGMLFYPHNWAEGWNESYEWKTDVLIARNRTEQRVRLRSLPRRRFDLRLVVAGDERRQLETTVSQRKSVYMFGPIWRDLTTTVAPVLANSSVITMPQSTDNYVPGGLLAIWTDPNTLEFREIQGLGSGFISVTIPFLREWPVGSYIAPVRHFISESRIAKRFTEDVTSYDMRLLAVQDKWQPIPFEPEFYKALPLMPVPVSWESPEQQYENKWTLLDNDLGTIEIDVQSEEPVLDRSLKIRLFGKSQVDLLMTFLHYCAGRVSPFFVTADDRGFELAVAAPAMQNFIIIKPINYLFSFTDCPARAHIEMVTVTGTVIRRQILSAETQPDFTEKLILDSALPVDVSASTLSRCAWLEKVRLNTDSIALKWHTTECVETNLAIVVLP